MRALLKLFSPGLWIVIIMALVSSAVIALLPVRPPHGLQMWVFDANHLKIATTIALDWNREHPDTPVEIKQVTGAAIQTRMLSAFYSGTPVADLIEVERSLIGQVFAGPVADVGFVDLTERLDREGLRAQINEPSFSPWTTRGHIFGLPHDVHPVMLAYRADLVEAAGIDMAKIETWDDYFRVLRPLMVDLDGDGRCDRYLLNSSPNSLFYHEVLLLQAGGQLFDTHNFPTLNRAPNARVLAKMATWYTGPNQVAAEAPVGGISSLQLIRQGYIIGLLAPDWFAGFLRTSFPDMAGKFKFRPLPTWEKGGRRTSVLGGTMLGITKASRNQEAAWGFAKRLYLAADAAKLLYEVDGIVTPIKSNWSQPVFDRPDPYYCNQPLGRMYLQLAHDVPLRPSSPYYVLTQQQLSSVVIRLCHYADEHRTWTVAGLEPEAQRLLDEAQARIEEQMNRNTFLRADR